LTILTFDVDCSHRIAYQWGSAFWAGIG
jgi:hypothetical protein